MILSCNQQEEKKPSSEIKKEQKSKEVNLTALSRDKECIPGDTSIRTVGVRYINKDSVFQVQVWIDKYDTILPYFFDCIIPFGLVPKLYDASKDIVCLLRGYAQEYRTFIVCYLEKGKIIIKEYETAMFTDLKNDRVVFQEYNDPKKIYVENIRTGYRKIFVIDSRPILSHFHEGRIENNRLILFYDKSKIVFSLNDENAY